MLVFRYDKTFEGLMTALFDGYSRKEFPEQLIGPGQPEPMFTTGVYDVVTDPERAARVWNGLEKILPKKGCNMLMHVWLSEEHGADLLLFSVIRKIFDTGRPVIYNFADADILRLTKTARRVSGESHRMIEFVRFQKASDDSYFAPISPVHNVLPLTINHFRNRFADQKWLIYDMKRRYGYWYDLETVTEVTLDDDNNFSDGKLDAELMAEDEKLFQELWKGYFKSLTIKERINPKLHRQHMPRRYWKYLTEKQ